MPARRQLQIALLLAVGCLPLSAAETHLFRADDCEYSATLFGEPDYKVRWSGERKITSAIAHTAGGSTLRASCGSWVIVDQAAFRAQLRPQMQRAARLAGLQEFDIEVRDARIGTVASFWGYRGQGRLRTWYRSDTYVGKRSFLELVVHSHPRRRDEYQLAAFRRSVQR